MNLPPSVGLSAINVPMLKWVEMSIGHVLKYCDFERSAEESSLQLIAPTCRDPVLSRNRINVIGYSLISLIHDRDFG